jgi:hypothetical protein
VFQFKERYVLRPYENRMRRKILGPKREQRETGGNCVMKNVVTSAAC